MSNFASFISKEESKKRLDICKKCEHYKSLTKICGLCYCLVTVKVKFDIAFCPDKKW